MVCTFSLRTAGIVIGHSMQSTRKLTAFVFCAYLTVIPHSGSKGHIRSFLYFEGLLALGFLKHSHIFPESEKDQTAMTLRSYPTGRHPEVQVCPERS